MIQTNMVNNYHTSVQINTTSNNITSKSVRMKMRFLTPLHPPSISERLESMKSEALVREKKLAASIASNDRFMKLQEKTRRHKGSLEVKKHQDRAKQLWYLHT